MQFLELLFLGAIAGFTIYFGLPIARMDSVSKKTKGMLNSAAAGILLFLLVDVMGDAFSATKEHILGGGMQAGLPYLFVLAAGVGLGLLGLVWFEQQYIRKEVKRELSENKAKRIAVMIAIGIGLHNFSEGLTIGQSYASGAVSLAFLLVVGFGLHNATEGFGIAAPLSGFKPNWKFLALLGLIGGGPTFLGAIVGGFWVSQIVSVFFLSLAAGAIIYVVKELLFHGRTEREGMGMMTSLLIGFLVGFLTQLVIEYAMK